MKLLKSRKPLYLTVVIIALAILLTALLWNIITRIALKKQKPDALAGIGITAETDIYQTRSMLLMEAMNELGSCTPESTAYTWAKGLKVRSAAMQYASMGSILKDNYAKQLETEYPNWVTGMSSPWIDSYEIMAVEEPEGKRCVFEIRFMTATSAGLNGEYTARLTMELEGHFWRITSIDADEELLPYTGLSAGS